MSQVEATAEVFLTAFRALPEAERRAILARLLLEEDAEDIADARLAEARRAEPSRSLDEYLSERKYQ